MPQKYKKKGGYSGPQAQPPAPQPQNIGAYCHGLELDGNSGSQCQDMYQGSCGGGNMVDMRTVSSLRKGNQRGGTPISGNFCDGPSNATQCMDNFDNCSGGGIQDLTDEQAYRLYKRYKRMYKAARLAQQ